MQLTTCLLRCHSSCNCRRENVVIIVVVVVVVDVAVVWRRHERASIGHGEFESAEGGEEEEGNAGQEAKISPGFNPLASERTGGRREAGWEKSICYSGVTISPRGSSRIPDISEYSDLNYELHFNLQFRFQTSPRNKIHVFVPLYIYKE